jgi:hypothetical protein
MLLKNLYEEKRLTVRDENFTLFSMSPTTKNEKSIIQ